MVLDKSKTFILIVYLYICRKWDKILSAYGNVLRLIVLNVDLKVHGLFFVAFITFSVYYCTFIM